MKIGVTGIFYCSVDTFELGGFWGFGWFLDRGVGIFGGVFIYFLGGRIC